MVVCHILIATAKLLLTLLGEYNRTEVLVVSCQLIDKKVKSYSALVKLSLSVSGIRRNLFLRERSLFIAWRGSRGRGGFWWKRPQRLVKMTSMWRSIYGKICRSNQSSDWTACHHIRPFMRKRAMPDLLSHNAIYKHPIRRAHQMFTTGFSFG